MANKKIQTNSEETVAITNLTMGYVVWYKEHYCVVSITPQGLYIIDDQDKPAVSEIAKENETFDVRKFNDVVPNIVIQHINEKYKNGEYGSEEQESKEENENGN